MRRRALAFQKLTCRGGTLQHGPPEGRIGGSLPGASRSTVILSCDPPRHAFLIHFGTRRQGDGIRTYQSEHDGARVQVAVNQGTTPPILVAVHFVRHCFRLPFVGWRDEFSTSDFHLQSGRREGHYFFHFTYDPKDCYAWEAGPGLFVLLGDPSRYPAGSAGSAKSRPVLCGLRVNLEALQVEVDMSEFRFELGADTLKDVPVTLFLERAP